jgi:hypothetical protein
MDCLQDRLASWVDADLVTAEQADAIESFEAAHGSADDSAAGTRGLPRWVEPIAYLGVALVAVALLIFGIEVWESIAVWGRAALAGIVTTVLLAVGAVLHRSDDPAGRRAASVAWLVSLVGAGGTAALVVLAVSEPDLDADVVLALSAGVASVVALVLYVVARTWLAQLGLAAALVALLGSLLTLLPLVSAATGALAFTALGVIWLLLTWGGVLTPPTAGWVVGAVLTLVVGFGSTDDAPVWSGVGIVVALGLVYLATVLDSRWVLAAAVLGLVVWIPVTVTLVFEGSVAVPAAILITGVATLAVVVLAVRRDRPDEQVRPDA